MVAANIGYPDWQRIVTWDGQLLAGGTAQVFNAGANLIGPFPVVNWASTILNFHVTAGQASIFADWAADVGMSAPLVTREYDMDGNASATLSAIVANRGSWLRIDVEPITISATITYAVQLTQRVDHGETQPNTSMLLDWTTHVTAAGNTSNILIPQIVNRPCTFHFNNGGSAATHRLDGMDVAGNYNEIYVQTVGVNGTDHGTIILPPTSCRVRITNTGASSDSWSHAMWTDPSGAS